MPIYEFFCKKCNTVFKFYSRTIDTTTIPKCPRCRRVKLERMFSSFATLGKSGKGEDTAPDIDASKLESALSLLERGAESVDAEDPRQAADFMRKLTDAAGISMGEGMEEALARMERGEDPDSIEAEMGELLSEGSFELDSKKKKKGRKKSDDKPEIDETLYEL
ncbi:MAG TPA: zinc ribbon domain-containing protein [Thermodesulfobacteriota bacterium]|nr:zinc ribbon domain-containing protein [Thermodesulfobacteriota bacterium]